MFTIYKPQYNPTNLSGTVGGTYTTVPLSGYLGELFAHSDSPPSGVDSSFIQYRKIFVRNENEGTTTYTRIWIDAAEHPEQISIARETSLYDTSTSPTGQPAGVTGWVSPSNYVEGLEIGTMLENAYTGIWVREVLTNILSPDPYATFRLVIGGVL